MTTRRRFLAAAVAGIAGLAGWRLLRSSDEEAVIAVLRKQLDYLTLDEQGLRDFARDLSDRKTISSTKLHLLDAVGPLYTRTATSWRNVLTNTLRHGEERVVSLYLLSSDFFANGIDETKVVRYVAYYDPLAGRSPCRTNPFARPPEAPTLDG